VGVLFSERLRGFSGRYRAADGRNVPASGQSPRRPAEDRGWIPRRRRPASVSHDRRHSI